MSDARVGSFAPSVARPRRGGLAEGWQIDLLYAVALLSLFIGAVLGGGNRALPFLGLSFLLLVLQWRWMLTPDAWRIAFSPALLAFMVVHCALAIRVSPENFGIRLLQTLGGYAFAVPFTLRYSQRSMSEFMRMFFILINALVIYVIIWHVSSGHFVVWKYLWDTKTVFSLLPFAALMLLTSPKVAVRHWGVIYLVASTLIILLSGERKAYIILAVTIVLAFQPRSLISYVVAFCAPAFLLFLPLIDNSGYVARQLSTITGFAQGQVVQTLSNQQREWQANFLFDSFKQHPLFGIGTNGYAHMLQSYYGGAAKSDPFFRGLGVHGEFLRVLSENGVLGIACWSMLLATSLLQIVILPVANDAARRIKRLALSLYFAMVMYMLFEAFDTTMMLVYCMIPHIFRLRFTAALASSPTVQVSAVGRRSFR